MYCISIADIETWLNRHNSGICVIDCRLVILAMAALVGVMVAPVPRLLLWLFAGFPFFLWMVIGTVVMVVRSFVLLGYEQIVRSY